MRKAQGGQYEVYNNKDQESFNRIELEQASNLKRLKITENDEYEGIRNTYIPVLQNDVNNKFSEFSDLDESDPDDEMADDDTKEDVDDYTDGFITRLRKRRNNQDLTLSLKL